jgi:phosphoribosylformylglycinamidine synthase
VKGTARGLAVSVDGNGRFCYLDPRQGAMLAVAEAARNVACAGATPIGATNCLNFGNPERPEIMWQLVEAVEGIAEACRGLGVPITGGNVSLYNETEGRAIYPTPVLGVVGLIEDASKTADRVFRGEGREIVLFGENLGELGGSEYQKVMHGEVRGVPPALDLARERALQQLLVRGVAEGLIESANDCSEGGVAVALAESAFDSGGVGLAVDLDGVNAGGAARLVSTLFGESASRVVASVQRERSGALLALAAELHVPAKVIGSTGGSQIRISVDGRAAIDLPAAEAERIWSTSLSRYFARQHATSVA